MKTETRVVVFAAGFVGVLALVYWFTSYEDAGTTMLGLAAGAYAMLSGYLFLQGRRLRHGPPRLEDIDDGEPAGTVEVGYFPVASVWPAALALGAVVTCLGLVFGFWFIVIGMILLIGAVTGYATEAEARP